MSRQEYSERGAAVSTTTPLSFRRWRFRPCPVHRGRDPLRQSSRSAFQAMARCPASLPTRGHASSPRTRGRLAVSARGRRSAGGFRPVLPGSTGAVFPLGAIEIGTPGLDRRLDVFRLQLFTHGSIEQRCEFLVRRKAQRDDLLFGQLGQLAGLLRPAAVRRCAPSSRA